MTPAATGAESRVPAARSGAGDYPSALNHALEAKRGLRRMQMACATTFGPFQLVKGRSHGTCGDRHGREPAEQPAVVEPPVLVETGDNEAGANLAADLRIE